MSPHNPALGHCHGPKLGMAPNTRRACRLDPSHQKQTFMCSAQEEHPSPTPTITACAHPENAPLSPLPPHSCHSPWGWWHPPPPLHRRRVCMLRGGVHATTRRGVPGHMTMVAHSCMGPPYMLWASWVTASLAWFYQPPFHHHPTLQSGGGRGGPPKPKASAHRGMGKAAVQPSPVTHQWGTIDVAPWARPWEEAPYHLHQLSKGCYPHFATYCGQNPTPTPPASSSALGHATTQLDGFCQPAAHA